MCAPRKVEEIVQKTSGDPVEHWDSCSRAVAYWELNETPCQAGKDRGAKKQEGGKLTLANGAHHLHLHFIQSSQ